ncbi:flavin reductase family protein [Pseudonocardia parietis]|uniref:Flavin reductase ActVB n=1 Tax=Pseudonocardia parietis TaxID=570936 RepID=A0ABS4VML4_9PSEU|nr:flavin reductase family protein [Pseudonocardia parietis]MBP2365173.1 flavin reductase ActVB [Pseudonocardia parietis]
MSAQPAESAPDQARLFREAMASFPSGVTIVTTTDAEGRWWGFTATSFCSASMDPPLVLVCLAETAECHPVFLTAQRWIVHVIHPEHADLALRFATRGTDKFADAGFVADERGLPVLPRSCVTLHCSAYAKHPGGDHTILLGRVDSTHLGEDLPAVYFRRNFHLLNTV